MIILSNLNSTTAEISTDISQYVGGVYMEMTYSNATKKKSYSFIEAVNCLDIYPNLEGSELKIQQDYKCPNKKSFELQGNLGQVGQDFVREFYYVVSSCQSMQIIYPKHFHKEWPVQNCKDYTTEIIPNLKHI